MKQYKSLQGGQAVIMSNVSEEQHLNSNIITINSNRIRLIKNSPPQVNVRNPSTFNDLMNLFFVFWQTLDVSYGAYMWDNPEQHKHHPQPKNYYKSHNGFIIYQ